MQVLNDWGSSDAPKGVVFDETLQKLGTFNRELLLFCAGDNVQGVRWAVRLGADWGACDSNGSTCLHVACRNAAIAVLDEVLEQRRVALEAVDCAGWTPLHIAAFMGRRVAVLRLLESTANPCAKTHLGQTPSKVCLDNSTRHVLLAAAEAANDPGSLSKLQRHEYCRDDCSVGSGPCEVKTISLRPAPAIDNSIPHEALLISIAVQLFNRKPGFGLALVVACGLANNCASAMSKLLETGKVDRHKACDFLGNDMSVCHTMRLRVFASMSFSNQGIVSTLERAFSSIAVPEDFQKIDRLVRGIATVWWRQNILAFVGVKFSEASDRISPGQLIHYLSGCEALSHLMFSTVLLHRHLHEYNTDPETSMDVEDWRRINRGVVGKHGKEIPDDVYRLIYREIKTRFIPGFALPSRLARGLDTDEGEPVKNPSCEEADPASSLQIPGNPGLPTSTSVLSPCATVEGWLEVCNTSNAVNVSVNELREFAGNDEVTSTGFGGAMCSFSPNVSPVPLSTGVFWATLCDVFMFFTMPTSLVAGAPHAMVDMRKVRVSHMCSRSRTIELVGKADDVHINGDADSSVQILKFLSDTRWLEVSVSKLEIKVAMVDDLHSWMKHFST